MKYGKLQPLLSTMRGMRVLHISDTPSAMYGDIEGLIAAVRPDVLIHTGDMADDIKIGRIDGLMERYKHSATRLIGIMRAVCPRVIVVLGNHDAPARDWLYSLGGFEIVDRPGAMEIGGVRFWLCHRCAELSDACDIALYGHGPTGDTHRPQDNMPGKQCWFNGWRCATLIELPSRQFINIPYQEELK